VTFEKYRDGVMKTKKQLLEEIDDLKHKNAELMKSESESRPIMEILQESDREKRAILDAMFDFVVLADENLSILWTNKAVNRQFGMNPERLKGRHCYSILQNRNEPCENCPALKALNTNEIITMHRFFLGKRWMARQYPLKDERKILAVYTDIT